MVDVVSSEAGIPRPDHPLEQSGGAKWFLPAFGVLVLAAARPQGSAEYARVVSADGPRIALLLLGHHALLLPDQSFLVLAPSMGGCTQLAGTNGTISLQRYVW